MNLLQSFMGCMYPGSIRTESVESMNNDYVDLQFQASNIDERGNEVSKGELQITDKDLIYFKPGKFPTRWPLDYIRRYGCMENGEKFVFEAGRKCATGPAIYAFRLTRGAEFIERLRDKIDNLSSDENSLMKPKSPQRTEGTAQNQGQQAEAEEKKHHRDASTSTNDKLPTYPNYRDDADPRPLSYALIDFDTTKALNELARDHATGRLR